MKRTDFTFRKVWMIYTVYFLLLFTPTVNAHVWPDDTLMLQIELQAP